MRLVFFNRIGLFTNSLIKKYNGPIQLLLLCHVLIIIRVTRTGDFFYLFLVWNLFLATLPYLISQLILHFTMPRSKKVLSLGFLIVWLLLLPNSPYLVTDLIHLHNPNSHLMWFDLFMVFVFAMTGLILGTLSLIDVQSVLARDYPKWNPNFILNMICLLCGFGVYMGRFLRFNSWDVLTQIDEVVTRTIESLSNPEVWLMTLAFGTLIWITSSFFQWLKESY